MDMAKTILRSLSGLDVVFGFVLLISSICRTMITSHFNSDIRNPRLEQVKQSVQDRFIAIDKTLDELRERRVALVELFEKLGGKKMEWRNDVINTAQFRCEFSVGTTFSGKQ